jgi:hypothetical protein
VGNAAEVHCHFVAGLGMAALPTLPSPEIGVDIGEHR